MVKKILFCHLLLCSAVVPKMKMNYTFKGYVKQVKKWYHSIMVL